MTIGKMGTEGPKRQSDLARFLRQQALERLQARNQRGSGFYPDMNTRVTETLNLSPEVQEKRQALQTWIEKNNSYEGIEKIKANVRVHNNGLHIKTSLGMITLAWKGHTFGWVNTLGDNLKAQKYTIQEMRAIIEALGGKKSSSPLKDQEEIGGPEISSFLSDIAGIKLGNFFWSSSEHSNNDTHAWGLGVETNGVYVYWNRRYNNFSSLASQN